MTVYIPCEYCGSRLRRWTEDDVAWHLVDGERVVPLDAQVLDRDRFELTVALNRLGERISNTLALIKAENVRVMQAEEEAPEPVTHVRVGRSTRREDQ